MYEDTAAYGDEGGGVEVEGDFEGFPIGEEGAMVDWRRRLRESSVCGRSLSYK